VLQLLPGNHYPTCGLAIEGTRPGRPTAWTISLRVDCCLHDASAKGALVVNGDLTVAIYKPGNGRRQQAGCQLKRRIY